MARRWVFSVAGAVVLLVAAAAVLAGVFGGHGSRDVAARTRMTPSPFLLATPAPSPTPTPAPRHAVRKHRKATPARSAAARHGRSRHHSWGSQADPCAHNHHCYVPPAPPLKPDPRPPIGPPVGTVSGAPVG
ncbi:hypothetical protein [Actinomadura sp. DC4]|uniref:hypothetical protein n=1 Tax=Actinomadura sp. DC4 TaxID=3055069 RepID=UPI0025B27248|nr:hypothetical protein [Actinomadura sp. DC4]MDN3358692.1 hypothetical protein [Actinomadura sp. DC4]